VIDTGGPVNKEPALTAEEARMAEVRDFLARIKKTPILKVNYPLDPDAPTRVARDTVPKHLLGEHKGPLYFVLTGSGSGHVVDITDQVGQGMQLTNFPIGDVTIRGFHLAFLGSVGNATKIYLKGGPTLSVLAPMDQPPGTNHVEFDGGYLLEPKLAKPDIQHEPANADEIAQLRDPRLTKKFHWRYKSGTAYVIYARPDTVAVPGDHELRRAQFPEIYALIEADRGRQELGRIIRVTPADLKREVGKEK
jgi:hypothetical protein